MSFSELFDNINNDIIKFDKNDSILNSTLSKLINGLLFMKEQIESEIKDILVPYKINISKKIMEDITIISYKYNNIIDLVKSEEKIIYGFYLNGRHNDGLLQKEEDYKITKKTMNKTYQNSSYKILLLEIQKRITFFIKDIYKKQNDITRNDQEKFINFLYDITEFKSFIQLTIKSWEDFLNDNRKIHKPDIIKITTIEQSTPINKIKIKKKNQKKSKYETKNKKKYSKL
jgi:hypothetical protein